jgi:hypothetical protein
MSDAVIELLRKPIAWEDERDGHGRSEKLEDSVDYFSNNIKYHVHSIPVVSVRMGADLPKPTKKVKTNWIRVAERRIGLLSSAASIAMGAFLGANGQVIWVLPLAFFGIYLYFYYADLETGRRAKKT